VSAQAALLPGGGRLNQLAATSSGSYDIQRTLCSVINGQASRKIEAVAHLPLKPMNFPIIVFATDGWVAAKPEEVPHGGGGSGRYEVAAGMR